MYLSMRQHFQAFYFFFTCPWGQRLHRLPESNSALLYPLPKESVVDSLENWVTASQLSGTTPGPGVLLGLHQDPCILPLGPPTDPCLPPPLPPKARLSSPHSSSTFFPPVNGERGEIQRESSQKLGIPLARSFHLYGWVDG